jgi:hypothetical protein
MLEVAVAVHIALIQEWLVQEVQAVVVVVV